MDHFYINKNQQVSGEHEVHRSSCYWMQVMTNKGYLGLYSSSFIAIAEAGRLYPHWAIDGCATCCPESHTR